MSIRMQRILLELVLYKASLCIALIFLFMVVFSDFTNGSLVKQVRYSLGQEIESGSQIDEMPLAVLG